jgi:hypothetical protein
VRQRAEEKILSRRLQRQATILGDNLEPSAASNYFSCDHHSPHNEPTTQAGRFADRRQRVQKRTGALKCREQRFVRNSCEEFQEDEMETSSPPADSHPQDEMGSDADSSDAESIPGASLCYAAMDSHNYAAMDSHNYRFELTLTRGPEQEILDQQEFGVHLTVKDGAGSESEEDRSVSDHDTHADHDARAGLRAEHEYELRELEGAEPEYEPGYAAEPESCPSQSDSPHHAGMVECNFSLTREEEEWVFQERAEYDSASDQESCISQSDSCEFTLSREEDDWVFGT